jgi:hypothetical protein
MFLTYLIIAVLSISALFFCAMFGGWYVDQAIAQEGNATAGDGNLISHFGDLLGPPSQDTKPETSSYVANKTVLVQPGGNQTAEAFCRVGDPATLGGYSIGFTSLQLASNATIYSNEPVGNINFTEQRTKELQEGWKVGLVNNGKESMTITSTVMCVNLNS